MPISEKGISSRVFLLAFFLRLLNPRLVSGSFRHYLRNPWLQLPMALALPKTFRFLISTIAYCFSFHCRNRSKHKGLPRNYNMQKKGRPLSLQVSFGPLLPSFRFSVSSFLLEISCRHGLLLFSVSLREPYSSLSRHISLWLFRNIIDSFFFFAETNLSPSISPGANVTCIIFLSLIVIVYCRNFLLPKWRRHIPKYLFETVKKEALTGSGKCLRPTKILKNFRRTLSCV